MRKKQRGSVTLETCLVLPIFFFLIMGIYGLFWVFTAHNEVTHALVQSSRSLSLDPYLNEKISSPDLAANEFWGSLSDIFIDYVRTSNDESFTSRHKWYESAGSQADRVAKDRFVGYFAGGDKDAADERLRTLGVVNGLEGITIKTEVEGEMLTLTISYKIQYIFDAFDLGKIPMKQSIKARLWMAGEDK